VSTHSVLKSFGIVSFFTFLSRIFGLLRDVVSAGLFGTTLVWDAFLVSFIVPNLFRRLLGEGALSSSFIPVFADSLKADGKKGSWELVNLVFSLLFVVTLGIVAVGILGIGFGEGFIKGDTKLTLILSLLKILLPYLVLVNLTALCIAALNSVGIFSIPATSPVVLNMTWILAIFVVCPFFGPRMDEKIYGLAYAILVGGVFQLGLQIWALYREGWRYRFSLSLADARVKRMLGLMGPAAAGLMLHQVNVAIDMGLGVTLGDGAVSSLWYGSRLMQFPLALFAIALGTVVFPKFSGEAASREMASFKKTLSFSLGTIFLIMIPAAVGLFIFRVPIVEVLFERNEFDAVSTARAATTLGYYCLGLVFYSGAKILIPCFYAFKDTRTPVRIVMVSVFVNLVLNLILMRSLREGGLALATALSGTLEFGLLLYFLKKKIGSIGAQTLFSAAVKMSAAAGLMGFAALWIFKALNVFWIHEGFLIKAVILTILILAATVLYVLLVRLFRVREIEQPLQSLKRFVTRSAGRA
jgi:putative peptidoglycan lipid II flippase